MRKIIMLLAAGAALLGAGYAFEANATMGVTVEGLKRQADSFSRVGERRIAPSPGCSAQGVRPCSAIRSVSV